MTSIRATLPSLRAGSELLVLARLDAGATGEVRLSGDLGGHRLRNRVAPRRARGRAPSSRASGPRRASPSSRPPPIPPPSPPSSRSRSATTCSPAPDIAARPGERSHVRGVTASRAPRPPRRTRSNRSAEALLGRDRVLRNDMLGAPPRAAFDRAEDAPIGQGTTFSVTATAASACSGIGEGGGGRGEQHRCCTRLRCRHPVSSAASTARKCRRSAWARPAVSGRLPPEVIQRIARRQFGRARLCYENGLRRNPALTGRVVVRFVIGRERQRQRAPANGGSDLPRRGGRELRRARLHRPHLPGARRRRRHRHLSHLVFSNGDRTWFAPSHAHPTMDRARPTSTRDDRWMTQGADSLDKLRRAVEDEGTSRAAHEALIRGLLARGRFADALAAAQRFAAIDPDLDRARELLAGAAAAAGEAEIARTALDAAVELAPRSAGSPHPRRPRLRGRRRRGPRLRPLAIARRPAPQVRRSALPVLRCRARLGESEAVLAEARAEDKPGKSGHRAHHHPHRRRRRPPTTPPPRARVSSRPRVRCEGESKHCPTVLVIKPNGDVISPWAPTIGARQRTRRRALVRRRWHLPYRPRRRRAPTRAVRSPSAPTPRRAPSASTTAASRPSRPPPSRARRSASAG